MENYQLENAIKDYARAIKSACFRIIDNELSLADRDMYLRSIITDTETIAEYITAIAKRAEK